ncbi:YdeI/OmpD-associated family protein [Winogradskyella sp. DF17]|jgi:hypothetical protein|uniref:YdeI/OmpD-associated family protein n=1 Tax=Winogradskyella pelagia TaxID=2819984 RepID=A0ABS3T2M2_9FLAO|nr:YdeI/OmpD-associated family protein [Winogradskyella sp. DF17]MBO3116141.1 YdeI/OmpD-associated family protein [Winogradskyella sp. DF17]
MLKSIPFEVSLANKQSIILPSEYIAQFITNKHKRIKVKASFKDKKLEFYAALKYEKSGLFRIYFSKAKQAEMDIFPNDYFTLQVFEDNSKYGVELSEEFEAVLISDYEAFTIFESLTPGKQRSIIYAISRYKSSQTKIDKSLIFTTNLKRGITDPKQWLKQN